MPTIKSPVDMYREIQDKDPCSYTDKEIPLTSQECQWLIDLIRADITDWREMMNRPVDEIGLMFCKLADTRISTMEALAEKFEEIYLL